MKHFPGAAVVLLVLPAMASEVMIGGTPAMTIWEAATVIGEGGLAAPPEFTPSASGFEGSALVTGEPSGTSIHWTIGDVSDLEAGLGGDAQVPAGCEFLVRTHVVSRGRAATGWTAVDRTEGGTLRPIPLGVRDGEGRFYPAGSDREFVSSLFGCVGISDVRTQVIVIPGGTASPEGE